MEAAYESALLLPALVQISELWVLKLQLSPWRPVIKTALRGLCLMCYCSQNNLPLLHTDIHVYICCELLVALLFTLYVSSFQSSVLFGRCTVLCAATGSVSWSTWRKKLECVSSALMLYTEVRNLLVMSGPQQVHCSGNRKLFWRCSMFQRKMNSWVFQGCWMTHVHVMTLDELPKLFWIFSSHLVVKRTSLKLILEWLI